MKRILAVALACLLLCGIAPLTASAGQESPLIEVSCDEKGYPILTCEAPPELADAGQLNYAWFYKPYFSPESTWISIQTLTLTQYQGKTLYVKELMHPQTPLGLKPDKLRFICFIYYSNEDSQLVRYAPAGDGTDWLMLPGYAGYFWDNWPDWIQWILHYILFGWLWMDGWKILVELFI